MNTHGLFAEAGLLLFHAVFGTTDLKVLVNQTNPAKMAAVKKKIMDKLGPCQQDKLWSFAKELHHIMNSIFKSRYEPKLSTDPVENRALVEGPEGWRWLIVKDMHTCGSHLSPTSLTHHSTMCCNQEEKVRPFKVDSWDRNGPTGHWAYTRDGQGNNGLPEEVKDTLVTLRELGPGDYEPEFDVDHIYVRDFGAKTGSCISTTQTTLNWKDPMRSRRGEVIDMSERVLGALTGLRTNKLETST